MAQNQSSTRIFDFSRTSAAERWVPVNDDVMGGVSSSRVRHDRDGFAVFEGTLSLENNRGFASVRGAIEPGSLQGVTGLTIRVRGDGQRYQLRLRMGRRFDGVAYVANFETAKEEWTTVTIPLSSFEPSFRGYRPRNPAPLDAAEVGQIGLMLTDKQEGPFRIDLGWIDALED